MPVHTTRRVGLRHIAIIVAMLIAGVLLAQQSGQAQTTQTLRFVCMDRIGQLYVVGNASKCPSGYYQFNLTGSSAAVTVCLNPPSNTARSNVLIPCLWFEQTVVLHGPTEMFACTVRPLNRSFTERLRISTTSNGCPPGESVLWIPPGTPLAANDNYVTAFEQPLVVQPPGILANDSTNSGTITAYDAVSSNGGTVAVSPDGGFTYTPPAGFTGADSFGYTVTNSAGASSATVTIQVMHVPVANADEFILVGSGSVPAPGVLGNDEVNGATITAYDATTTAGGSIVLNADGSFVYTAPAVVPASDTFTYTITNPVGTSTATVTLNLNEPPVANADSYATDEDTPLIVAAPGVLGNDTDPDGDSLSAVQVTGVSHGSVTLNADGSFSYTPDADFNGTDSFSYRALDTNSSQSGPATVTITVNAVNDGPTASNQTVSTTEDNPTTITLTGSDLDGDPLTFAIVSGPANGSLGSLGAVSCTAGACSADVTYTPAANYAGGDSFTFTVNDGTVSSTEATITINVSAVNDAPTAQFDTYLATEDTTLTVPAPGVLANDTDVEGDGLTAVLVAGPSHASAFTLNADGSFSYTPVSDYNGDDTFTYKANDGQADSNVTSVTITVSPENDAPVANSQSVSTDEDMPVTITLTGSDADGDGLTFSIGTGPTYGTLGSIGSPSCSAGSCSASVTYTPAANYNGSDSFTFTVFDGSVTSAEATVSISVAPVNDAPVAVDDSYDSEGSTSLTVAAPGVLGNDSDIDLDPLTAVLVDAVTGGTLTLNADGSFTYTANPGTVSDSFTYKANDGQADSNVATVTITINALPVADAQSLTTNEDSAVTITLTGSDADDEDLTFEIDTPPGSGTLGTISGADCTAVGTCSATVQYTPSSNFNGTDSFTFTVNDGHVDSAAATISITVNPINDAPNFTAGSDQTVLEDSGLTTVNGWATAISAGPTADEAGQTLTFNVSNDNNSLFSVQPDVDEVTGNLTFTVAPNMFGSATVTVSLSDDGGTAGTGDDTSDAQTFTITITAVNDEPSFTKGGDQTATEDAGPQTLIGWATGISAGPGESGQILTFNTSNDNPSLFSAGPTIASDGTLTYTPAADAFGSATITVSLSDDGGTANGGDDTSATQTFTITVSPVNDAPTLAGGTTKSFNATAHLELSVTQSPLYDAVDKANEVAAGSVLSARVANDPASVALATGTELTTTRGGTVIFTATGFRYQPPTGVTGGAADTAAYYICDTGFPGPGLCTQVTLSFSISGELVWFINGGAGAGGTGTMFAPFNSITAFNTYNTANAALTGGDVVFIYSGTYTNGITLVAGQRLFGQGAPSDTVFHTVTGLAAPVTGSAYPSIVGTAPNIDTGAGAYAVTLNTTGGNNTLRYLTLGTAAAKAGEGITGTSFGTLTVGDVAINTDGQAINLTTGTLAPVSGANGFTSVDSAGGTNNVALTAIATSSSFSFGTGGLSGATGNGVAISQQNGTFSFGQTITNTAAGAQAVSILNRTGGTVTFSGSINPTSLDTAAPTANSRGIAVSGSSGTYTFSGAQVKISSTTLAGVNVTGGSPTVEFTGGRLAIVTTTGNGLSATAGTLRVTGANNSISSSGGIALNVNNATIGTGGLNFVSISANGGSNGIFLANTGSTAGLTVAGSGSVCTLATPTCTGGTINGTTGANGSTAGTGIYLSSTQAISLTNMRITGTHQNYGIRGSNVTGFSMTSVVMDGTYGNYEALPDAEGTVVFNNLLGTSTIATSHIQNGYTDNVRVINSTGTATLAVTSTTIRNNDATGCGGTGCGNDGINFEALNAANMTLSVTGGSFSGHKGDHVNVLPQGSGTVDVTLDGIAFTGGHPNALGGGITFLSGASFSGTLEYTVTNNTISGTYSGGAMHFNKGVSSGGTFRGTVTNNVIGTAGIVGSGCEYFCSGLRLEAHGGGAHIVHVLNNLIQGYTQSGIDVIAGENGSTVAFDVTIGNNEISTPDPTNTLAGIYVDIGVTSGPPADAVQSCLDIGGFGGANTLAGSGGTFGFEVQMIVSFSSTIRLPGYTGMPDGTGVDTYIQGRNPGTQSVDAFANGSGATFANTVGGASCSAP